MPAIVIIAWGFHWSSAKRWWLPRWDEGEVLVAVRSVSIFFSE